MYDKPMLSLDQVRRAMNAMLDKATQEPDRPVAIAVVDDAGNLLSYARMDGCRTNPADLCRPQGLHFRVVRGRFGGIRRTVEESGPHRGRHGQP